MGVAHAPHPQRWSSWAWGAIAVTAAFIAISCWWVHQDHGVPFADAASHLITVVAYYDRLHSGDFGKLLYESGYYPPLTFLTGAIASLIGGLNASTPVIGENLVYGSLIALGCYHTGKLVAGPAGGFLAVLFVLGSPLLIEQMHVFMIDAPQAALVAVAVWLILASDRFRDVRLSAAAGTAVGAGMASKEQFALFVAGLLVVVVAREQGWRNRRGMLAFAACTLVIAAPWYVANLSKLSAFATAAGAGPDLPARGKPPLLSVSNAGWYVWALVNGLLFAPLFAFAAIGTVRAGVSVVRARPEVRDVPLAAIPFAPELLGGLLGGWLGLTLVRHHDMRYAMGLLVYLAVLGTAWIVRLRRTWRIGATAALASAVVATTLGASFGIGGDVRVLLAGDPVATDRTFGIPPPSQLTVYADQTSAFPHPSAWTICPACSRRCSATASRVWRGTRPRDPAEIRSSTPRGSGCCHASPTW
ncbi:MAG TPA: glycosyltransferase family 39 protein [Conexibacter sp.]|nr:glycosyltransferase family 39 protein [Conexibacter sp.]